MQNMIETFSKEKKRCSDKDEKLFRTTKESPVSLRTSDLQKSIKGLAVQNCVRSAPGPEPPDTC